MQTDKYRHEKELTTYINNALQGPLFNAGLDTGTMRDKTWEESAEYRELVEAVMPHLCRLGELTYWRSATSKPLKKPENSRQMLLFIPGVKENPALRDAPAMLNVPEDHESDESSCKKMEPENMTRDELERSMAFYLSQRESMNRLVHWVQELIDFRESRNVPRSATLRQFYSHLAKGLK